MPCTTAGYGSLVYSILWSCLCTLPLKAQPSLSCSAGQQQPEAGLACERQVQRQLDDQTKRLILEAQINTAENLPLGPGEWQHDHAGTVFYAVSILAYKQRS